VFIRVLFLSKTNLQRTIVQIKYFLEGVKKKLSNKEFVAKAPAEVIVREKTKMNDWKKSLEKLEAILSDLN
jgi:valyl-tRNA synthetase